MESTPQREPDTGFAAIVARRYSRREVLRGALGLLAGAPLGTLGATASGPSADAPWAPGFSEVRHGADATHHVAAGYRAAVLLRWGDPVLPGAPAFDPQTQSAASQRRQFGYNCDDIAYLPLPRGSDNPTHGLLCVNHEHTDEELMFPGVAKYDGAHSSATAAIVAVEMASLGCSIVEVRQVAGRWQVVAQSRYARRVTAGDTPMRLSGPAAGSARLRTGADPDGVRVIGTVSNCAGGVTPWGTYLTAEENFNDHFVGELTADHPERRNYARYDVPGARFGWGRFEPRFHVNREPNEANRFGWIVEIDPYDPASTPVKRTALGRFCHEGATCVIATDGRLAVYSGDDARFEYLYKFVSRDRVDPADPAANRDLLDHGTLYAARFADDGGLRWLPLVHGANGLTAEHGFASQADVLIEARRAAGLLGATPMDRPEDVAVSPVDGRVYVMLTNNAQRGSDAVDAANPRAGNLWGQILELTPQDGDHAAPTGRWEMLVQAGDPADPAVGARWNPRTSADGWFACPDNCAFDPRGGLWICTDQGSDWRTISGTADGLWAVATRGSARGTGRMFFRGPIGCEVTGPCFTPDGRTLFLAVQHPAREGAEDYPGFGRPSTFADPATRWPDFDPELPPRPAVVAITREDGGPIGH